MATVAYPHIDCTREGRPFVAGTQTKVVEVVLDRLAYHWDADEIHRQHPHLSLRHIYSALAYYYDHQTEMDREIDHQRGARLACTEEEHYRVLDGCPCTADGHRSVARSRDVNKGMSGGRSLCIVSQTILGSTEK
jgi:uncharacterized protein (DUF433 family)